MFAKYGKTYCSKCGIALQKKFGIFYSYIIFNNKKKTTSKIKNAKKTEIIQPFLCNPFGDLVVTFNENHQIIGYVEKRSGYVRYVTIHFS